MLKRVKLKDVKGKALTGYALTKHWSWPQAVLVFGDRFVCIGVDPYTSNPDEMVEIEFDPDHGYDYVQLVQVGIYTEKEMRCMRDLEQRRMNAAQEAHDLAELARLKAKYEPAKTD